MKTLLSRTLIIVLLAGLAGCGFQLRGNINLPQEWRDIYLVSASPNSELSTAVRDGFQSNDVAVTERATANYILYLGNEEFGRRNLTIRNNARASEFELEMTTSLSVTDSKGEEVMAEIDLSTQKVMTHDPENVTGKVEESRLLQREMRQELAQMVLRQIRFLAAATPAKTPVPAKAGT